jgi:hypothetical protein
MKISGDGGDRPVRPETGSLRNAARAPNYIRTEIVEKRSPALNFLSEIAAQRANPQPSWNRLKTTLRA